MAGLDPAIHVFIEPQAKTWMPGTRPGMTETLPTRLRIIRPRRDDRDHVGLGSGRRLVARLGGDEWLLGLGGMKDLDAIKSGLGVQFRLDADQCHGKSSSHRRHCEERERRSNPDTSSRKTGLLRFARNDDTPYGSGVSDVAPNNTPRNFSASAAPAASEACVVPLMPR